MCGNNSFYTINDSYNTGNITGSVQYVGGVCGYYSNNSGATEDIIRCYNTGIVRNTLETTYPTYGYTGGICGWYNGNILSQCYNTGNVTVNDTYYTGGICGKAGNSSGTAKISECCNSGAVTSSNDRVGGIAGLIDGCAIENCYNTGAVEGNMYVGGLWGDSSNDSVTNCYNAGAVTATKTSARNPYLYPAGEKDGGIFTNVYYNSDVNVDIYNQNPDWGRTTAQLTAQTALSDLGFDTEKWSKTANTSEYLYYPDLKNIANDNPAFSTSTPLPTGLTASAGYDSITLTWDEFSGATKYAVYYSTDGSDYTTASNTVTDTSYTITELVSGQKYYFKIQAYVSDAWTYFSKTIEADTDCLYVRFHSLILSDDIGVKFYIEFADNVLADSTSTIKFTVNGRESNNPVSEADLTSSGYAFICPVAAAEMNDTIKGQLYVGGKAVGDEFTYSVKTYADYILENSAEYPDEVPLVNAMLNYGAAAEKYFRGSTDISFTKPDVSVADLVQYKYIYTDNDSNIDFVG